ncbi:MAG TPA: hypothetical protein VMX35_15990 [Acidobacteriota bacterium]|nr:hypothetical protein [Acidobacteriota bacterium]
MGNVLLNGAAVEIEKQPHSLLELVAEVEQKHLTKEWIIVEVKADDDKIESFTYPDGSLLAYDPEKTVCITARKSSDILVDILVRFEGYLGRMMPGIQQIVALFRSGDSEEANKHYRDVIEGIRVLIELIQNIRQTGMVGDEPLSPDGKGLGDLANDLKGTLEELVRAQGEGAGEQIADALEFELIKQLYNWQESLPELRRIVESQHG